VTAPSTPTGVRVLISGGATGGHLMPGLAIADALRRRGYAPHEIHFLGAERGIDTDVVPAAGFGLTVLPGRGIERRFTVANLANIASIVRGVVGGVVVVGRMQPDVVVVLGGYASVPGLVGALVHRVPLIGSEQNAVPSLAIRLTHRFARATAVPTEQGLRREVVTGNPVRKEVAALAGADPAPHRTALGFPPGRRVVVVFGGSLGSLRINEAVLGVVTAWSDRDDVAVHHVVGHRDWPSISVRRPDLSGRGIWYRQLPYDEDLPTALAAADLVVCRAGASTVAELTTIGRPAILIPGPWAPNDAQAANASLLAEAGAALVIPDHELDADSLGHHLATMLTDGRLAERAAAAAALGRPEAAEAVAVLVEEHRRG